MKYKAYVFCPLAPSAEVVYPRYLSRHSWSCKMHVLRMVRTSVWGGQRAPSNLSSASSLLLYTIMGLKWLDSWARDCNMPGLPVYHQLPEFTQTHIHGVSDAIQPSHPLSSIFPSSFKLSEHQGLFRWVSSLHHWPKYRSFSFSISPSIKYWGLISFGMDWLDLLAVQGTQESSSTS